MKTLLLLVMFTGGFAIRYLRWLAFLQQKEYRLDRIKLFISSEEGRQELLRVVPHKSDFSRAGCKRPKLTKRMSIVIGTTMLLLCVSILGTLWYFSFQLSAVLVPLLVLLTVLYLAAPALILIASAPTAILSRIIVEKTARAANKLLAEHSPVIIGITGSYGKSSTKALLHHLLSQKQTVFATPKSYNTLFSISKSILDGYTNQKVAIIEYAAYVPGEITRITRYVHPNMALITGFAPQHLGLFGSAENIQKAKAELVAALSSDSVVYSNAMDSGTAEIVRLGSVKNKVKHLPVDWQTLFTDVSLTNQGCLTFKRNDKTVVTHIVGKQYIENIALAWSVAHQFLEESELIKALESFEPPATFIRMTTHQSGRKLIDDGGSSNPKGFTEALALLESFSASEKIVVTPGIVDLGSKSDQIHTELAERMNTVADIVCYVGESGSEVSAKVLGKKMLTDQDEILSLLQTKKRDGIVLVEGRMPAWIQQVLGSE